MVHPIYIALIFLCFAAPATATTVSFSHLPDQPWSDSAHLPGLTIEAGREQGGRVVTGAARIGHGRGAGLGVLGAGDSGLRDGSDQIDSFGANDVVIFRFDRAVRLERITFTGTDFRDRFDLYLGADLSLERQWKVDDLAGYDWVSSILLGAGHVSDVFAIGASDYQACGYDKIRGHNCWTENSAFRIASLTFSEISDDPDLSAVPLPPTLWMLLFSFLGLSMFKRRHCLSRGSSGAGIV
ncbi:MAG: hypothetical protein OIF48_04060 [Silicimonas sp.]|nr:hypothetical protein [Silicimonas sp.]